LKLLVLAPIFPDAPVDGDRLRLYHWLHELGSRHQIHLACFADPARPADWGASRLGSRLQAVHRVGLGRQRRRLAAGLRLGSQMPVNVSSMASPAMAALVDRLSASGGFDALLCYRLKMAPYGLRFRGPRVLDYTDSLTRYAERRSVALRLEGRRLAAAWWKRQARQSAAYEAFCAGHFDAGFFNSRQDCDAVRGMAPAFADRLQVAANGVAQASRRPGRAGGASQDGQRIVFVGHLAYAPNAEALQWFITQVLPLIRARRPQAQLQVIGGDAPAWLRALDGRPGVRFAGPVPDVAAALAGAALSVCPVRSGAGRQNKLLEAFAAGVPAVATRWAAEGAEAVEGRDLLAADSPAGFAAAALRVLKQPALGRRLALGGRALVKRLYRWPANARKLELTLKNAGHRAAW
jgi:glycosyltransferase involved in cell wall biosynthesis